jgi:phenylalanyl-tRNA synthetase beta chain
MRVPLGWLADYVALDIPAHELADKLTMTGLKVEAVEQIGADWEDVRTGKIVRLEPHPTSNKPLWVAEVDVGDRAITIVTGAPNVSLGAVVPVVLVGGRLPHGPDGNPMRIESRPMAGITSQGMLCSERELGISDEHSGILILPPDTPTGVPLRGVLGEDVLDIETNPNRPDTLSIIGIAREVAAITEQQLTLPDLGIIGDVQWLDEESIRVDVDAPDLCPRYAALRIEGVENGDSPRWLAERLRAAGMRPISLLVDLTNYVMLEYGQPMHAFDATQLAGNQIIVRRATESERMTTLDGVQRVLNPENLVIADRDRAVAIAGVMGGENSEISPQTTTIVLESATFDPISVRRTMKALGLRTESSVRFEKGLAPEQTILGLRRYLQLLSETVGRPLRAARTSDVWVGPVEPRVVSMPLRDLHRLVGVPITIEAATDALSLLGFGVRVEDQTIRAEVPFWRRVDIELSADLVEEVARLVGFDTLPATLPLQTMPAEPLPAEMQWEARIRDRLIAGGVNEAVTHSLTSPAYAHRLFGPTANGHEHDADIWAQLVANPAGVYGQEALTLPVELANPATQDRQMLRMVLLPSVLDVVARNLKQTDQRLAFFEIGRTFFQRPGYQELPYERRTLAIALSGHRRPPTWSEPRPGPFSFFDLKGLIAAALDDLHVDGWSVEPGRHPALHPGRAAVIRLAGQDIGYFGELHPEVAPAFDIEGWPVQAAELDLDALFAVAADVHRFRPLPRYPAAFRDIAVVVEERVPAAEVMGVIRGAGGELLESCRIFDVYTGAPLQPGQKSIAAGLIFRAPGATLTQEEVNEVMDGIVARLQTGLGATLRE